jgi:hypothetical protein
MPLVNGMPIVNNSTINDASNRGLIFIYDETDLVAGQELNFIPINLVTGNTAGVHWIIPGALLSNNFEVSYSLGQLTINKAQASIELYDTEQTYDGSPRNVSYTTSPEGLAVELTYDESTNIPVNAGTYNLSGIIYDPNYQGNVSGTLTINPAVANIILLNLAHTYDAEVKTTGVITTYGDDPSDLGLDVIISYTDLQNQVISSPVDAGQYIVIADVDDLNFVGHIEDMMSIAKAEIAVKADDLAKIYGAEDPALTYTVTSGSLYGNDTFSGDLERATGEDVNIYTVNPGTFSAGDNYNLSFVPGSLQILKAELIVTADPQGVNEGEPLPDFEFNFLGFVAGDTELEVFGVNGPAYTLSPEYIGEAGVYFLVLTDDPVNYYITKPEDIILYVNPYGPGTRAIRPVLNCVETLHANQAGLNYIAHFRYENENDEVVYIPEGEDNNLIAEGEFWIETHLPEVFEPGTGHFEVFFDGTRLTWLVASREEGHKASISSEASSSSSKCKNKKSMPVSATSMVESMGEVDGMLIYPNPATERVYIRLNEKVESDKVMVFDFQGKSCFVEVGWEGLNELEINLNGLTPGLYLIRIETGNSYEIGYIVKQ